MAIDTLAADRALEPSAGTLLRRRVFGHFGFMIGLAIIGAILAIALLAPLLAPHDPYAQDLSKRLINPIWGPKGSWLHPLGTDQLGRDYLSRLIYGSRISLLIGFSAAPGARRIPRAQLLRQQTDNDTGQRVTRTSGGHPGIAGRTDSNMAIRSCHDGAGPL